MVIVRKLVSLFLCLILLFCVFSIVPFTANAKITDIASSSLTSGTTGDCTWSFDNSVLTISGKGAMGNYSTNESRPWDDFYIRELVIENGVTSIGTRAFFFCNSIKDIIIPNTVKFIGNNAFARCNSLTSIEIPDSVTRIDDYAFYGCDSLSEIKVPDTAISIGEYALVATPWYINQPDGIIYAGNIACYMKGTCPTNVILKEGTKAIADQAFFNCTTMSSITIPHSVIKIGEKAFYLCNSLKNITIPDSVSSIGADAFRGCRSLKTMVIPDLVTSIDNNTFSGCSQLEMVVIPSAVTSIASDAFNSCSKLVIYGFDNSYAKTYAMNNSTPFKRFYGKCLNCGNLLTEDNSVVSHENITDSTCLVEGSCDEIIYCNKCGLEGSRKRISLEKGPHTPVIDKGYPATYEVNGLTDGSHCSVCNAILKPQEVILATRINPNNKCGDNAYFSYSSNDTILTIFGTGDMYDYSEDSTPWSSSSKKVSTVIIEEGITSVGSYAFDTFTRLSRIVIPNSIITIHDRAFNNCPNISRVAIPSSVTFIGDYAFSACRSVEYVFIPESVTHIGSAAFSVGDKLKEIEVDKNNKYYSSLDGILYNKDRTEYLQYPSGKAEESIIIPEGVQKIGEGAFYVNPFFHSVVFPSTLKIIGVRAFSTTHLYTATLPKGLTTIEDEAFMWSPIYSVELPNTLEVIGDNAFMNTYLKSIVLPQSLIRLGIGAFSGSQLKEVTIPALIKELPSGVFAYNSLNSITIPRSVISIDKDAFAHTSIGTVYGYSKTEAEAFARKEGYKFVSLPSTLGDADGDGEVTILDATSIQRNLAELSTTGFDDKAADADEDGEVTILDATAIQRNLAELPTNENIGKSIS